MLKLSFSYYSNLAFLTELLLVEMFIFYNKERKSLFPLRVAVSLFLCYGFAVIWPLNDFNLTNTLFYFILFLMTGIGVFFCFRISYQELMFWASASYAIQHCGYNFYNIVFSLISSSQVQSFISYLILYLTFTIPICLFLKKRAGRDSSIDINRHALVVLSCIIVILTDFLNYVRILTSAGSYSGPDVIGPAYALICCGLALTIQFGLLERSSLKKELHLIEYLWDADKKHYEIAQENIDLINLKCHDMKHQIAALKSEMNSGKSYHILKDMEDSISVYDSFSNTGNKILDTLFSQKALLCQRHNIIFTCFASYTDFHFMETVDLYSILGNLLDNAIEASQKIDNPEKRIINLSIDHTQQFICILLENCYENELDFYCGLPVTSKDNHKFHGYGLKSVTLLVHKYRGHMTISNDNHIFQVTVMFPAEAPK